MMITGLPIKSIFNHSKARINKPTGGEDSGGSPFKLFNNQQEANTGSKFARETSIGGSDKLIQNPIKEALIDESQEANGLEAMNLENSLNPYAKQKAIEEKMESNPEQSLTQRIAMKNFLFKMKKELNIAPEELINAFAKLTTEELLSPPEQSLETLLSNLELNREEQQRARTLFHQMLKQTASTAMADYLKESNSDIAISILSKKELQNKRLQDSVLSINQQFFVNPKENMTENELPGDTILPVAGLATNSTASTFSHKKDSIEHAPGFFDISGLTPTSPSELSQATELMNSFPEIRPEELLQNSQSTTPQKQTEDPAFLQGDLEIAQNFELQSNSKEKTFLQNLPLIEDGAFSTPTQQDSAASVVPKLGSEMVSLGEQANTTNDQDSSFSFKEGGEGEVAYSVVVARESQVPNPKEFVIDPRPTTDESQEAANVKEVVNQARLMIKKGGGEMKIHLSPQGLGEVTMKVNVENGKVNVEMLTDNSDAKKIIEKGISELKATLASHKLNVENIKVDTSADLLGDLSQKQREAERQFAQQFMGEFRNNNNAWRENFLGFAGTRAYKSQTQDEAENPFLTVQSQRPTSRAERRLDLVA